MYSSGTNRIDVYTIKRLLSRVAISFLDTTKTNDGKAGGERAKKALASSLKRRCCPVFNKQSHNTHAGLPFPSLAYIQV